MPWIAAQEKPSLPVLSLQRPGSNAHLRPRPGGPGWRGAAVRYGLPLFAYQPHATLIVRTAVYQLCTTGLLFCLFWHFCALSRSITCVFSIGFSNSTPSSSTIIVRELYDPDAPRSGLRKGPVCPEVCPDAPSGAVPTRQRGLDAGRSRYWGSCRSNPPRLAARSVR